MKGSLYLEAKTIILFSCFLESFSVHIIVAVVVVIIVAVLLVSVLVGLLFMRRQNRRLSVHATKSEALEARYDRQAQSFKSTNENSTPAIIESKPNDGGNLAHTYEVRRKC